MNKICSNLITYIFTNYFTLDEIIRIYVKLNKRIKGILVKSIPFQNYMKLIQNTPSIFKKIPERILTVENKINPIKILNFSEKEEKDYKLISNYLYYLIRDKEELLFYDKLKINTLGFLYLSYFISFPECNLNKLSFEYNIINEEDFLNSGIIESLEKQNNNH